MKKQNEIDLDEIISIIRKINPIKIYLFGSYATATFDDKSDIYDRRIGLDLLVYTPAEFKMLEKEPSSFISSAIRQGIKIYDSEAS